MALKLNSVSIKMMQLQSQFLFKVEYIFFHFQIIINLLPSGLKSIKKVHKPLKGNQKFQKNLLNIKFKNINPFVVVALCCDLYSV